MPTWLEAFKATHPLTGSTPRWIWIVIVVGYAREIAASLNNDALVASLAIVVALAPPWIFTAMNYRAKHSSTEQPHSGSQANIPKVRDEASIRWEEFWKQVDHLVQAANGGDTDAYRELDQKLNNFRLAIEIDPEVWDYAESYLLDRLADSLREDSDVPFSSDLISLFIRHGLHEEQFLGAALARRAETRIEDLWTLANFENGYWEEDSIAEAVAETTNDVGLLQHLSSNSEGSVRRAVAKNPATPQAVLFELAADAGLSGTLLFTEQYEDWNDAIVACGVLENPKAPKELVEAMSDGRVRIALPVGRKASRDGHYVESEDMKAARKFIKDRATERLNLKTSDADIPQTSMSNQISDQDPAKSELNFVDERILIAFEEARNGDPE